MARPQGCEGTSCTLIEMSNAAALAAAVFLLSSAAPARGQEPRPPAEWAALREAKFAIPEGQRAFDLLREMNTLVSSPDPFLRDNVAYEAAARWIYGMGALSADEQRQVLAIWTANLRVGLGETSGSAVYGRSFSALNLSVLAARDNAVPFLTRAEYGRFLGDVLDYFLWERDTRGYVAGTGWIHATAHTADVLKFLARSPKLTPEGQARILRALDAKCATFGSVFQWAEDERLGQVVASLARRPDLNRPAFDAWLASIGPRRAALWSAAPSIDPAKFPEVQNLTMVLRAAFVALSLDAGPAPAGEAAAALLATLKGLR